MFSQVELGFGRIPLKLERHPRTLHHGKSWVYRHDVRAHELHPAITIASKMNLIRKSRNRIARTISIHFSKPKIFP
jgi:hypothetical protein